MSHVSKPINFGSQICNPERFADRIVHACRHSHASLFRPCVCRNTEYRHMTSQLTTPLHFTYFFRRGNAIHDGHFCIHKDDMEFFLCRFGVKVCCSIGVALVPISGVAEEIDCFLAIVCCPDHIAFVCKLAFEYFLIDFVIFRNEDVNL